MLQLTHQHLNQYIGLLEESDKAFVGKIQRDPLAQAQADIFFQLGIRDKELMKWGLNQVNIVKGAYQTSCSSIINRFQTGKIGFEKAFSLWQDTTKTAMTGMYRSGAATVGNPFYKDLPIPTRDRRLMARYLNREGKFWKGLLWDIKDLKHTSFIPRDPVTGKRMPGYRFKQFSYSQRAGMYPQSMEAMRYNGMIMGSGENVEIRWVKGSPQTETCVDCEALSTRMWTPYTLPTSPRAGGTKCLWKCYCHLEIKQKGRDPFFDMAGSGTEGAMMAAGRYSQVFDTAGNAVGGQLQRDIEIWSAEMNRARQMMTITKGKDRMFWIAERKRFNRFIIDRTAAGQYKAIPTVSVSALRKTILSAQAKGGALIDDFMLMPVGKEVWFVRSDYSSFGTIGIRNGVRVFKSPSGVILRMDPATDVIFAAPRGSVVWKNMTNAELVSFVESEGLNIRAILQWSNVEANDIVRTLYELKKKHKVFWSEVTFEAGAHAWADYGRATIGLEMGKSYTLKAAKANYQYCKEQIRELNPLNKPLSKITNPDLKRMIIKNNERMGVFGKIVKSMESGKYNYYKDHSIWAFKSTPEAALRHELGHVLAYEIDESLFKRFFPWKQGMKTIGKWPWQQKNYGITWRAMDNWAECLAENFALYSVGKTQGMHRDMIKFFDYIFGGGV